MAVSNPKLTQDALEGDLERVRAEVCTRTGLYVFHIAPGYIELGFVSRTGHISRHFNLDNVVGYRKQRGGCSFGPDVKFRGSRDGGYIFEPAFFDDCGEAFWMPDSGGGILYYVRPVGADGQPEYSKGIGPDGEPADMPCPPTAMEVLDQLMMHAFEHAKTMSLVGPEAEPKLRETKFVISSSEQHPEIQIDPDAIFCRQNALGTQILRSANWKQTARTGFSLLGVEEAEVEAADEGVMAKDELRFSQMTFVDGLPQL